ncbi:MAG: hypothetical protein LBT34_01420 [Clostridiales Family XIII bacterium]|nr:hypothetical protein [Clostridiales Family XIII bacterium]
MELIAAGLKISALGLGGVFAVLILFYAATKVMLMFSKISAAKQKETARR